MGNICLLIGWVQVGVLSRSTSVKVQNKIKDQKVEIGEFIDFSIPRTTFQVETKGYESSYRIVEEVTSVTPSWLSIYRGDPSVVSYFDCVYCSMIINDQEQDGEYFFLFDINMVFLFNISFNVENPRIVWKINLQEYGVSDPRDASLEGTVLYVLDWSCSLLVLDVSDKTAPPIEIGIYPQSSEGAFDMEIVDSFCYMICDRSILILDISNTSNFRRISVERYQSKRINALTVRGDLLYTLVSDIGLVLYNISNKESPEVIVVISFIEYMFNILQDGDYLYVGGRLWDEKGNDYFQIYDISIPSSPVLSFRYKIDVSFCWMSMFYVEGDLLYIADEDIGLIVFDVSNKTYPIRLHVYDEYRPAAISIVGNFMIMTEYSKGFLILEFGELHMSGTPNDLGSFVVTVVGKVFPDNSSVANANDTFSIIVLDSTNNYEERKSFFFVIIITIIVLGVVILISLFISISLSLCICLCICCGVDSFLVCIIMVTFISQQRKVHNMEGRSVYRRFDDFDLLEKKDQLLIGSTNNAISGDTHQEQQVREKLEINIDESFFKIQISELKVIRLIGSGGSNSKVFLCKWIETEVAFKCFETRNLFKSQEDFNEFVREVEIMAQIEHPNCLKFFGCTLYRPRIGIEYCSRGDLKDFLYENETCRLRERLRIMIEICKGLNYLHEKNIIHRDVKSENVLISEDCSAKIIDFGLSKMVSNMSLQKTVRVGTSVYMAPEVVFSGKYGKSCDIFSFSIIMWEVLSMDFNPYGPLSVFNIEYKVASNDDYRPSLELIRKKLKSEVQIIGREEIEEEMFLIFKKILVDSWARDPNFRPSFPVVICSLRKATELCDIT